MGNFHKLAREASSQREKPTEQTAAQVAIATHIASSELLAKVLFHDFCWGGVLTSLWKLWIQSATSNYTSAVLQVEVIYMIMMYIYICFLGLSYQISVL